MKGVRKVDDSKPPTKAQLDRPQVASARPPWTWFPLRQIEKDIEEIDAAGAATFARTLQGVRQNEVKELIARLEKPKRNLGGADDA